MRSDVKVCDTEFVIQLYCIVNKIYKQIIFNVNKALNLSKKLERLSDYISICIVHK